MIRWANQRGGLQMVASAALGLILGFVAINGQAQETAADRVVAKVGDQTVMLSEVDALASRVLTGVTNPNDIARIRAQVLEGLIFEKAMTQRIAREKFLDNPEMAQAYERAKREALFNVYVAQKLSSVPLPNEQAVNRFINQNPDLFQDRQTFRIREVLIASRDPAQQKKYAELAENQGIDALVDQLRRDRIPHTLTNVWRGGEQVDREYRAFLASMRDGQIKVRPTDNRQPFMLVQRLAAHADPVRPEDARQAVASGLVAEARERRAAELRASIRGDAGVKILDVALKAEVAALAPKDPIPVGDTWGVNRPGNRQMVFLIWSFMAMVLAPLAIWQLVRKGLRTPKPRRMRPERFYETWARGAFLKISASLLLLGAVFVPVIGLLTSAPVWLDQRTLLVSIPAAGSAVLAVVLIAAKVADLRKLLETWPWAALISLMIAQAFPLAAM